MRSEEECVVFISRHVSLLLFCVLRKPTNLVVTHLLHSYSYVLLSSLYRITQSFLFFWGFLWPKILDVTAAFF